MAISKVLVCAFNVSAADELEQRWQNKKIVQPSKLQQDVINGLVNIKDNIIVGAVAGSGKTSLLMSALNSLNEVENIDLEILNIHKIATRGKLLNAAIGGKYKILGYKFDKTLRDNDYYKLFFNNEIAEQADKGNAPNFGDLRSAVLRLVDLIRLNLIDLYDYEAIAELASSHGLFIGSNGIQKTIIDFICNLIEVSIKQLISRDSDKYLDYTDLIYMPVYMHQKYGFTHSFKFDLIVVDECQDLSKCQLELIKLCSYQSTRYLFVGDPFQAIYGFAGADTNSFNRIKEDLDCVYYPLSVNYRCPKSVIELAQKYCTDIQACDHAPIGEIKEIKESDVAVYLNPHDMVLCRLTAPLIKCAIQCIKLKKAAKVKGRDIAKQLTNILIEISKIQGFSYDDFYKFNDFYFGIKINKLKEKLGNDTYVEILRDQHDALETCYSEFILADSIESLSREIENIFSADDSIITLQTIHRAKGSEADVIYILNYDKMPYKFSKTTDEQYQQEKNLTYVALTRCKFNGTADSGKLFLVNEDKKK